MKLFYVIINGYGHPMHLDKDGKIYNGRFGTPFNSYEQARLLFRKAMREYWAAAKEYKWSLKKASPHQPFLIISVMRKNRRKHGS